MNREMIYKINRYGETMIYEINRYGEIVIYKINRYGETDISTNYPVNSET